MVNTYSKSVDGKTEYYYQIVDPLTMRTDGELIKMTEAEAVAAELIKTDNNNAISNEIKVYKENQKKTSGKYSYLYNTKKF